MNNLNDLSNGSIDSFQKQKDTSSLKDEEQLRGFKKEFFSFIKIAIFLMFAIAYTFMLSVSQNNPNTGATVIIVTSLMIPTVITLALIRFLYAKKELNEKTAPSVSINLIKEIIKVFKDYLNKKS